MKEDNVEYPNAFLEDNKIEFVAGKKRHEKFAAVQEKQRAKKKAKGAEL